MEHCCVLILRETTDTFQNRNVTVAFCLALFNIFFNQCSSVDEPVAEILLVFLRQYESEPFLSLTLP